MGGDERAQPDRDGGPPTRQPALADRDSVGADTHWSLLELQVADVFEHVLEPMPPTSRGLDRDDDFFALGGDSMAALALSTEAHTRWGVDLDIAGLMPEVTIRRVAVAVRRGGGGAVSGPVVALRTVGARQPLVLVHPSGGSVFCYLDLVRRMPRDRPLWGVRGPDPRRDEEPMASVVELAGRYGVALEGPVGPTSALAGYSFGGYVALEMARRQVAAGSPPPFLALMDTRAPTPCGVPPERGLVAELAAVLEANDLADEPSSLEAERRLWDDLGVLAERHLERVDVPTPRDRKRRRGRFGAIQQFFRAYRFLPTDDVVSYRDVRRFLRYLRAAFRASRDHEPAPYDGPVLVIQAAERLTDAEDEADRHAAGWARYLRGPVERRVVAGHHLDLLSATRVDGVARALVEGLDRWPFEPAPV